MNVRSYQKLKNGVTRMDLERLAQIAEVLETSMEDLLRQDGIFVLQKIRETGSGSDTGNIYNNYGADKEVFDKLLATKDAEINLLKEESQSLKEEVKYLKEKIDQLMEVIGKKE